MIEFFRDILGQVMPQSPDAIRVEDLQASAQIINNPTYSDVVFDGSKFDGGFGDTNIFQLDYWTLRRRSVQLMHENLYARGLIRRLVTNEINTGLCPEATPDEKTLGFAEEALNDWTEEVETAFDLWARTPAASDFQGLKTFYQLQAIARAEALVAGDVLQVMRYREGYPLPQVQLVSGSLVGTPFSDYKIKKGHTIKHGVELDQDGRHVAYWVLQDDFSYKRLEAYGKDSGRLVAKLVYGTDKRMGEVRGEPLLSLVLQSLKEIDRYRDSTQRKAVINSFLALFIKKTQDKVGSLPFGNGAVRREQVGVLDGLRPTAPARRLNVAQFLPGMVFDELQVGEEPVLKGGEGTDLNFGTFESAIISAVAWANEIPPEILTLAFSNNYSASQAAINEFKIYLNRVWADFGADFCSPVYIEFMIAGALEGMFKADSLLKSWRDTRKLHVFAAWVACDWYGSIKPSTDMLKQVKGSELLVAGGYSTRAREARITTGTKYSKNVKRLKRENEQLAEAMRPMLELKKEFGINTDSNAPDDVQNAQAVLEERIDEIIQEMAENDFKTA